jgi:hypothetical protein
MKILVTTLILVIALLACGCTSATAPAGTPASPGPAPVTTPAAAIANLTGTWAGPMTGYDQGVGFSDYPTLNLSMVVEEQRGRVFSGTIHFVFNGTPASTGFAGVIGRDGRTFAFTEEGGGYATGDVISPDEIEVRYLQEGSPYSAAVDSFRRV